MQKNKTLSKKVISNPIASKDTNVFWSSLTNLYVTKNLALCGIMAALGVILSTFATLNVGPYLKIGFSSYPNRIIEYLFGPVVGCIFGGTLDIIKYIVAPSGPFTPIFTFIAMLSGLVCGLILYNKPLTLKRVIISQLFLKIVINIICNSLALYYLYGYAFVANMPMRIIKNAIQLPIDIIIMYSILKFIQKISIKTGFKS